MFAAATMIIVIVAVSMFFMSGNVLADHAGTIKVTAVDSSYCTTSGGGSGTPPPCFLVEECLEDDGCGKCTSWNNYYTTNPPPAKP